jgi:hypothetical protein
LSDTAEMMSDVCSICLDPHERHQAVTLKNEAGNPCHEMGMCCFLQWSQRSRDRRTQVQCPMCKSRVSTIVYQYCLPTAQTPGSVRTKTHARNRACSS